MGWDSTWDLSSQRVPQVQASKLTLHPLCFLAAYGPEQRQIPQPGMPSVLKYSAAANETRGLELNFPRSHNCLAKLSVQGWAFMRFEGFFPVIMLCIENAAQ